MDVFMEQENWSPPLTQNIVNDQPVFNVSILLDYLQHAACIKEKSTSSVFCGSHYNTLVDQVKGVQPASQRELCW